MTLETHAQPPPTPPLAEPIARLIGMTREERLEAMQATPHPTIEERRPAPRDGRRQVGMFKEDEE